MHRLKKGNWIKEEMGRLINQRISLKVLKAVQTADEEPRHEKSCHANLIERNEKSESQSNRLETIDKPSKLPKLK